MSSFLERACGKPKHVIKQVGDYRSYPYPKPEPVAISPFNYAIIPKKYERMIRETKSRGRSTCVPSPPH